ncbi:hypothetical protein EMIT0P4_20156 [Pseudomonas sp. IT-P4]
MFEVSQNVTFVVSPAELSAIPQKWMESSNELAGELRT